MKTMVSLMAVSALCAGVLSCQKGKSSSARIQGNYVIAGTAGGFAAPSKKDKYFLINNGQLWLDYSHTDQTIPTTADGFSFTSQQSQADYAKAASLLTDIPQDLLTMKDTSLGTIFPDAGYTDVRASINGTTYHWIFQGDLSTIPADVQLYAERIHSDLPW